MRSLVVVVVFSRHIYRLHVLELCLLLGVGMCRPGCIFIFRKNRRLTGKRNFSMINETSLSAVNISVSLSLSRSFFLSLSFLISSIRLFKDHSSSGATTTTIPARH